MTTVPETWWSERYDQERLRRMRAGDDNWDGFFTLNGPDWLATYRTEFRALALAAGWSDRDLDRPGLAAFQLQAPTTHWDKSPQAAARSDLALLATSSRHPLTESPTP